jgi:precorrin-6B methylase 1
MKFIQQKSTGAIVYREEPHTDKTLTNASEELGLPESDLEVVEQAGWTEENWNTQLQSEMSPQEKIDELERQVTQRRIRDAIAGTDGGWLANQESLIAEERSKL